MSLDTLSLGIGFAWGSIITGIGIYRACKPKKIYIEHSREGITAEILDGFGIRKRKYTNFYKIRPEEYDGRERTDVLRKIK